MVLLGSSVGSLRDIGSLWGASLEVSGCPWGRLGMSGAGLETLLGSHGPPTEGLVALGRCLGGAICCIEKHLKTIGFVARALSLPQGARY